MSCAPGSRPDDGGAGDAPLALADVTVLAVEQFGAGPWATQQLADLGARVIKIEQPSTGGDVGRYVPPYAADGDSLYFESFNRGKESIALDLGTPEAYEVFTDLARRADAVVSNLRGDVVGTLKLRYEDLAPFNRRIVCCSLSGFGMTGPRRAEGAYDHTIQGLAGWQALTGEPDAPPTKSGLSLVDFSAGYAVALATLAGILGARRDGRGCEIDLALFDVALSQLNYVGTWAASRGYRATRTARSGHPSIVPFGTFPTRDRWIVIACPKDSLWRRLCTALDAPGLADDPRFATMSDRTERRDELTADLDGILAAHDAATWLERLRAHGVPCAPINDVDAALADEQAVARGVLVDVEHPALGTVRHISSPLRLSSGRAAIRRGPRLAEHTHGVLRELAGYDDDRIERLHAGGVIGVRPAATSDGPAR